MLMLIDALILEGNPRRLRSRLKRGASLLASVLTLSTPGSTGAVAFSPGTLPLLDHVFVNGKTSAPVVPVAVFGNDQRQSLPPQYRLLQQQIGLLHNPKTNTLCTAFCIAPDMIATASHCLFGHHKAKRLFLSDFILKLGRDDRNKTQYTKLAGSHEKQSRRFIITGTSKLSRKPPIGAAKDWAIVKLERPACANGWLKAMPLRNDELIAASNDNKVFQVAFHMDFGDWDIAYSRACTVSRDFGKLTWENIKKHFATPQSLILHRCDTGEASSGSPLLIDTKDGPRVVGINVGTYQQRDITIKNGKVVHRSQFRTIANTAVSADAFAPDIEILSKADVLTGKSDMKSLQVQLRERGYYRGAIDGVYGSRTELAVKAFERGTKRPVTGLATREILHELVRIGANPVAIDTTEGVDRPASAQP